MGIIPKWKSNTFFSLILVVELKGHLKWKFVEWIYRGKMASKVIFECIQSLHNRKTKSNKAHNTRIKMLWFLNQYSPWNLSFSSPFSCFPIFQFYWICFVKNSAAYNVVAATICTQESVFDAVATWEQKTYKNCIEKKRTKESWNNSDYYGITSYQFVIFSSCFFFFFF